MILIYTNLLEEFSSALRHPLSLALLQISFILLVSKGFGRLARAAGQPPVVGEIGAGLVLGPSVVGHYFPETFTFLFPPHSIPNLQFLSQIGLLFFMFLIGSELDLGLLRHKLRTAVAVSYTSIIFPYVLGILVAIPFYERYAPPGNHSFLSFALFMGIAMSITAFPVLAKILQEKGLTRTTLGQLAMTCAAVDDVTAWCILAAVVTVAKSAEFTTLYTTLILLAVYLLLMLYVARPLLRRISRRTPGEQGSSFLTAVFILLFLSSCFTEVIGIHALFGAFFAGVVLPRDELARFRLREKMEDVSLMLLPLFFVLTGLKTQIGLLGNAGAWLDAGLIIALAIGGKFGGSALAARLTGQTWSDSLKLGALMNTRGLMELVVLNIGYDLHILKPDLFAMMVLMAFLTTVMTGPLLDFFDFFRRKGPEEVEESVSFRNTGSSEP